MTKDKQIESILRKLEDIGLEPCACAMSCDKSTVSRLKEHIPKLVAMLDTLGLRVVPSSSVCVPEAEYRAILCIAGRALSREAEADRALMEREGGDGW